MGADNEAAEQFQLELLEEQVKLGIKPIRDLPAQPGGFNIRVADDPYAQFAKGPRDHP